MKMHDLEQVDRAHGAYCATLEYRNLVEYLDLTTTGRYYLQGFCHRLTKGVEEGTFPYHPFNDDDIEPFLLC
jgi:hypothetical protein